MNMKLHPSQFRVNEAWILFRLTFEPIITERDGPVVGFGLMDAASCFLLNGAFFLGTDEKALSEKNVQELLRKGWAHKKEYPSKLLVPEDILTDGIEKAAEGENIPVSCVPESNLLDIIGEAQEEFRKRFGDAD